MAGYSQCMRARSSRRGERQIANIIDEGAAKGKRIEVTYPLKPLSDVILLDFPSNGNHCACWTKSDAEEAYMY
jgi:hypothetical protein